MDSLSKANSLQLKGRKQKVPLKRPLQNNLGWTWEEDWVRSLRNLMRMSRQRMSLTNCVPKTQFTLRQ